MRKILKFKLAIVDRQEITVPNEYEVLSAKEQYEELMLWILVNDVVNEDAPIRRLVIQIIGTGNPIESKAFLNFVDTVVMSNGLVWHVFENN